MTTTLTILMAILTFFGTEINSFVKFSQAQKTQKFQLETAKKTNEWNAVYEMCFPKDTARKPDCSALLDYIKADREPENLQKKAVKNLEIFNKKTRKNCG